MPENHAALTFPNRSVPPHEDRLLTPNDLSVRWGLNPTVTLQRARQLGIPILKFNRRSFGIRLSDILAAERSVEST